MISFYCWNVCIIQYIAWELPIYLLISMLRGTSATRTTGMQSLLRRQAGFDFDQIIGMANVLARLFMIGGPVCCFVDNGIPLKIFPDTPMIHSGD